MTCLFTWRSNGLPFIHRAKQCPFNTSFREILIPNSYYRMSMKLKRWPRLFSSLRRLQNVVSCYRCRYVSVTSGRANMDSKKACRCQGYTPLSHAVPCPGLKARKLWCAPLSEGSRTILPHTWASKAHRLMSTRGNSCVTLSRTIGGSAGSLRIGLSMTRLLRFVDTEYTSFQSLKNRFFSHPAS